MDFCCIDMERCVDRDYMVCDPVRGIFCCYIKDERHYGKNGYGQVAMCYCPFCGAELHKYLLEEYRDELEKAVGKEYCDIKEDEIPEEFKSDEWWKKRGL